jgi:hypothetical protein
LPERSEWRALAIPSLFYAASRVVNLVGIVVAARWNGQSFGSEIRRWDSAWFLKAATVGYPHYLPVHHGRVVSNTIAFFPLFPMAVRGLSDVTRLTPATAGLTLSLLTGLTATLAVWAVVDHYADRRIANRAAAAFAFFPGSFVFGLIYSDGLVLTLVALSLLALLRRRWLAAGVLGALATASAPASLMLIPAGGWAAFLAWRRDGERRAILAPLLTPIGFFAYQVWTFLRTGHANAWTLTERQAWHSYLWLKFPWVVIERWVAHPFAHLKVTEIFLGAVFSAVALALLARHRHRPPAVVAIFAVASIVLVLFTTPLGARPRMILWAFPLVTVWASVLGRIAFVVFLVLSALGLGALTVFSLTSWVLVP